MLHGGNSHCLTISAHFFEKILEMTEDALFMNFKNIFLNLLPKKSFSVLGGVLLNTLNLFLAKCYINFFNSWQMHCHLLKDFLNALILSNNGISHSKAFKNLHYKIVFLDWNRKNMGFGPEKTPKSHKMLKNVLQKKIPECFIIKKIKLLILLVSRRY